MDIINKDDIKRALVNVGVAAGQVVYLQSNLSTPGRVLSVKSKQEFCQIYFDSILELIGDNGTLVVPTYTTQVARFGIDFIWEETPSLLGIFTEFVRNFPGSLRSIHPLHSVCAFGKQRDFICANNGTSDFGWDSPFHRMLQARAKILTIGLESGYVVGVAHHLEAACCLPYVYNKLLKWTPFIGGKKDERSYFSCVRYLNLDVEYDLTVAVKYFRGLGHINSFRLGGSWVHMSDYEQVFTEGAKRVRDNPFFFLKRSPVFIYGEIPFDGPTAHRDNIASKNDVEKLASMNWSGYYLLEHHYAGGDEQYLEFEK